MSKFQIDQSITISTKHKAVSVKPVFLILVALIGCICMFSVCFSMIRLEYNISLFWFVTLLSILSTSILSLMRTRLHFTGYIPLLIGFILMALKFDSVIVGFKFIYNFYYCAVHNTDTQFFKMENILSIDTNISWFLCCASIVICSVISRTLIRKESFIIYFAITFIPIEFGLYEGLKMNLPAILILVASWFCVLSLDMASHQNKKIKSNNANSANCGIAMFAIAIVSAVIAVMLCNIFKLTTDNDIQSRRSELRENIENLKWEDIAENITDIGISLGLIDDPDKRELGTKSRLEYREEDNIQVMLSEPLKESIYLKSFTGSIYEDNKWKTIPLDKQEGNNQLIELFTKFECTPQILPFMNNQAIYNDPVNAIIKIKPLRKTEAVLLPYAAYSQNCSYLYDTGCSVRDNYEYSYSISLRQNFYEVAAMALNQYYLPTSGFNFSDSTTNTFFKLLNVNTSQESISLFSLQAPYLDDAEYKTQSLQAILSENYAYRQFVYNNYASSVHSEALEEVYESLPYDLYEAAQSDNKLEILGAIRHYLDNTSKYTLSPGETPSTRDFINYFLLENNKGYCMHFATAGTVIARYFGIPSRYCEGYVVSADLTEDCTENEDGFITVNVPDSASHAWCEYYIDGYGWVPYEFTPGYYDLSAVSQPFENMEEYIEETTEIFTEAPTETSVVTTASEMTTISDDNSYEVTKTDISNKNKNALKDTSGNIFLKIMLYILILASLVAAVIYAFILARNYALNKRKNAFNDLDTISGIINIYKFLMLLLRFNSVVPDNDQLLDFAEKAEKDMDDLGFDASGISPIIKSALAADMGGKSPSRDDINAFIKYVNLISAEFAERQNTFIRIIMKYWYHII
ncbi:MAG: transglutaminase-like domain-containing protein [Ruminococcus sp.]|nr:transglutaminase-like domain-containing protein [Ruminococcus sp.]